MNRLTPLAAAAALAFLAGDVAGEGDAGAAKDEDPGRVWLTHMRACLAGVWSAEADFTQEIVHPLGPGQHPMEGLVRVRRGGLLRLDYRKPEKTTLVSDGTIIRSYNPATRTVFENPIGQSPLPAVFGMLAGDGPPVRLRWLGGAKRPGEGLAALELPGPARDPLVARVVATVDEPCPCLRRVLVVDRAGSAVRITLGAVRTNVGLGRGLFVLKAPPGAAVVKP
ncbi:MAG: outer membrane lipoprotein carrier protein LolA [Deltaproteobacteria bacterium]|nr:outer membrane lipoprotein carrier protein LolA [Deltaproteobacteria bacterium]